MFSEFVTGQIMTIAEWYGVPSWIIWTVSIFATVATIVGLWKVFGKTGEKKWKAIIPFYNYYTQYKLTWKTRYFWIALVLLIAQIILYWIDPYLVGYYVYYAITIAIDLALTVIICVGYFHLIRAFDCSTIMILGFIIYEPLFMLILGFSKKQYQGNVYLKNYEKRKKEKSK